ncbi:hypothetical protein COO91_05717 [Nostoc flagelliforme CCNUN1]|uniref:Uncharacterized protein n=1 Tax=Nostoc flagelliforme CCNUN1 TaxID=2038116 RepID=A0A2K8SW82_9NOSO|nr:hypothetical protein COO91_05717 [Nostoc flagelliforme CCNUN1]
MTEEFQNLSPLPPCLLFNSAILKVPPGLALVGVLHRLEINCKCELQSAAP